MPPTRTTLTLRLAWPFAAACLLLGAWLAAREAWGLFDAALDLGVTFGLGTLLTLGLVRLKAALDRRAVHPPALEDASAQAGVAVLGNGGGSFTLFATSAAGRASVAETARRLEVLGEHSGLPTIVRSRENDSAAQLTLDAAEATPLHAGLSAGSLAARALVGSLLQVVGRVHARGFIVGDLPPGAIGIRADGSAVLLLLAPPTGVAPSARASPEVARGLSAEARDDVYSLAAVLVEQLVGLPFLAAPADELARSLESHASSALASVIVRCLGTRDERPKSVAALRAALDEIPWQPGFVASLHERLGVLRHDPRLDDLERRRAWLFFERVSSRAVGELSVTLRSLTLLELAFRSPGALALEGAFLEAGAGHVLGTVTRGRVVVALASLDLRELAQLGLTLRTPSGELHDLGSATVQPALDSAPDATAPTLALAIAARDPDERLALLRGRTALSLRVLSTDALLANLAVPEDAGGPPADIRARLQDAIAERSLLRSERVDRNTPAWRLLGTLLPPGDPAHAALAVSSENAPLELTLEDRARGHTALLETLAGSAGRWRDVARQALGRAPASGHAISLVSASPARAGVLFGTAVTAVVVPESTVESARAAVVRTDGLPLPPELALACERASTLAHALLGYEGCPRLEIGELPWSARLVTVPLFVAIVLARSQRNPLPRQVVIAAPLGDGGRLEPIGDSLEGVVEAAMASGARLLFVPHSEVEAARAFRAARGADARDLVVDALPDLPLRELVQLIEQRLGEHFPSQLELDPRHSRRLLEQAEEDLAAARPELALASLGFLQKTLARRRSGPFANIRAACLADTGRCRNARGQWRLALEAFTQAGAELESLNAERTLDWSGAELMYELPYQKATCLLHAFAFDVAERVLRDDIEAKTDCALVSAHSLARSHGALGRVFLEWGVASGGGRAREEHYRRSRESLATALETIDEDERAGPLQDLGLLACFSGDFDQAERIFAQIEATRESSMHLDQRRDRALAALGRVVLETRRGFAGDRPSFARAAVLAERALATHVFAAPTRARLLRLAGTSLLECGELTAARAKLIASREAFGQVQAAGSFLRAILPEIELARLEWMAGRRAEATRWIGDALARLDVVLKQIVGVSPFATEYVTRLARGLESARSSLSLAGREFALRDLSEVLGRVFY